MKNESKLDRINKLIKQIEEENILNGEAVGFSGEKTEQYICFEKLMNIASDQEFLSLSKHKNAVVRCYAIWTLSKMKYEKMFEVIKEHIDDVETVETFFGCRLGGMTVIEFSLNYCNLSIGEKAELKQMYGSNPKLELEAKKNIDKLREQLKTKYFNKG